MDTLDLVGKIFKDNPSINSFTFSKYPSQSIIQNELYLNEVDNEFIRDALRIRNDLNIPFWDSLMISFFERDNISEKLLSRALLHNQNVEKIKTLDTESVRIFLNEKPGDNLSLNSEVNFKNGSVKHLFLLDFHVYQSEKNLKLVTKILQILGLHGYVLCSGASYHFISCAFFDLDSLINLLAKSLLFSPIIDRAWVAHQILERSCSLRVGEKHGITPTVIAEIRNE